MSDDSEPTPTPTPPPPTDEELAGAMRRIKANPETREQMCKRVADAIAEDIDDVFPPGHVFTEPTPTPTPPTDDELTAWDGLAKEATPGPWIALDDVRHSIERDNGRPVTSPSVPGLQFRRDSDFVAALHPGNALRLIAEVKRLRGELEEARPQVAEYRRIMRAAMPVQGIYWKPHPEIPGNLRWGCEFCGATKDGCMMVLADHKPECVVRDPYEDEPT